MNSYNNKNHNNNINNNYNKTNSTWSGFDLIVISLVYKKSEPHIYQKTKKPLRIFWGSNENPW